MKNKLLERPLMCFQWSHRLRITRFLEQKYNHYPHIGWATRGGERG